MEESRLITGISLLTAIRMLGVSIIIPVFSIFATGIEGATPALAGAAVGIFGISQTIFQVPIGIMSDRWGRKQMTMAGLAVYFIGTVLSGLCTDIYQLIAARFIAGAGAVSGVTLAWLTDGISLGNRNRALSYVGMSIGFAVIAGFSISPVVAGSLGVSFLFYICAALTVVSGIYAALFLENNDPSLAAMFDEEYHLEKAGIAAVFRDGDLIRINIAGLVGSACLSGMFFVLPILINRRIDLDRMWVIYLPMAVIGTALMFFFSKKADVIGPVRVAAIGFGFEMAGVAAAMISEGLVFLFTAFVLFYAGNCIISPVLPAAASKYPSNRQKGTIMSMLNSSQFIGSGIGGLIGGLMLRHSSGLFFAMMIILLLAAQSAIIGFRNYER